MLTTPVPELITCAPFAERRAIALANAKWFRALAWRALRDGQAHGSMRAARARAAARIVLQQAKRDALINTMAFAALAADPEPEIVSAPV